MKVAVTCVISREVEGYAIHLKFGGIPTQEQATRFAERIEKTIAAMGNVVEPWSSNDLTKSQRDLIEWLGADAYSQMGECSGADLDFLVRMGMAQIHAEGEHQDGFIATGTGDKYRAVSLTDAGRAAFNQIKYPKG